jgi:hypothetical protein
MTTPFGPQTLLLALVSACGLVASAGADEWGTLKGKFVLGGDLAAPAALTVDKDVEVCGKHKLVAEELVIGEG